ncbi:hypothetical protein E1B28_011762 [Marasmius oreades]|uniref:Galactose mutarotase-like protein n=1 Tax=Marasmius oreades TaxID=181124 RepID=A0A9P7UQA7_9AGAR|nr:uncharacterized protein E1B28_011762 [Marasmius oreades]KAG7090153.1 hypothetical protein E1B28_011762 [Marasmius oreades]
MLSTTFATFLLASLSFVRAAEPAWPFDVTTLSAPDGSITAKFVSVGATMTELWVKDRNGKARDVILGYDDNTNLLTDPNHPVFISLLHPSTTSPELMSVYTILSSAPLQLFSSGSKGTFSIPITKYAQPPGPGVYQIPTNDHDGQVCKTFHLLPYETVTLHGGILGWDRRNWTIVSRSPTSVTYKHVDPADEGFPGNVTAFATHSVSNGGSLKTSVFATATEKTPIMLTQHIYWNLDAFQDGTNDILSHHLQVDSSKVVDLDGNAIPTGKFISATGTPFDFRNEQEIGARWNTTKDLCGPGCQGYDHCWIYDRNVSSRTGTSLWSDKSGIRLDITSNQPAVQVYTSFWLNTPRKVVHGGPSKNYTSWSAVAIEQEGYVDAINTPEWGVDQIYGPDRDFTWSSTYKFSVMP